jgi:capsular polysaccharide biosynthesis protein
VTLSRTMRVLLVRWYITVPGLFLSLAIAGVAFSLVPPQYRSDGTAVLVQPKPPGLNSANPLLTFDASLNTTALIVVQALNAPDVATELGLTAGKDTFTVKNEGSVAVGGGQQEPFISVTAQSPDPATSADIVVRVMGMARQELVDRQNALNVAARNAIRLQSVVDATPPKPVLGTSLAASAASLILGIIVTIMTARVWDRFAARRIRRNDAFVFPTEEDIEQSSPVPWSPAVAVTTQPPNGAVLTGDSFQTVDSSPPQTNSGTNVSPRQ